MTDILVIRLGALGDFVLSFAAFAAIRARHAGAKITLLTTAPFAELARMAPWFDRVIVDRKPGWWNPPGVFHLMRQLRGYDFVYDLQTSSRTAVYFRLAGRPQWSGVARRCSHPHDNPLRDYMHTLERQHEQLEMAGIERFPEPDLSWLPPGPKLPAPYALLIPGAAPHRPRKRWPVERFGELAGILAGRGLTPIVVGSAAETKLADAVGRICPLALDMTGRTAIVDLFGMAAHATLAVGNDTGPMHLAAASGCPSVVLFSADSDPALTAPRGPGGAWPTLLREARLTDLPVERVAEALP